MTRFGYAGTILKVNLSDGTISKIPSEPYTERFLGGRGLAARLFWEMVPPEAGAFDADNCLIYATGPATGFDRLAGCRWQVCGKSAAMQPEIFSYANLGERWGTYLKYAGYDALVVQGRAERPVFIYINNNRAEIRDASTLWGKTTFQAADTLKAELGQGVSVLTIGPAAENGVIFATMLTDDGASGASGLGAVMGSKNLKAIAVAGDRKPVAARPDRLGQLADRILELRRDTWKGWLNEIPGVTRQHACYGCGIGCFRKAYNFAGRRYKFFCQAVHVYWLAAEKYASGGTDVALHAVRLCDQYGLDTTVMQPMIDWLANCYRQGIINEKETGLPLGQIGSADFIEKLTGMITYRQGFGELLARGTAGAAAALGKPAMELLSSAILTRANETKDYDPRLVITNAVLYATEPRRPINQVHELTHALWLWCNWTRKEPGAFLTTEDFINVGRNFWGGEVAADFSTYEGKARAAKMIQDRTYAKESLILCDFLWPIIWVRFAPDHTGHPEMESQVLAAITGQEIDRAGLDAIGERIFNLQRAIFLRQGWGGRAGDKLLDYLHDEPLDSVFFNPDCLVPGKNGAIVSRKGARIDRKDFENLKGEYYSLRGWDVPSGLPTAQKLRTLGLDDIISDLSTRGLVR